MTFSMETFLLCIGILAIQITSIFACHGQLLASGLKEGEKEIILQEHNRLRQMVATGRYPGQPGAENMREIVWDDELALRAQQWAENCQFRHDPHRTINRFTMGQNLAIIWSTAPLDPDDGDFPSRIQNWFNEVQKYSFGDAWSPKTGHYSQLVWGETSLVGCGYAEYKDNVKYNKLYVCNYGPGGNVIGYNPYEVGKPSCASYGMKPSARYHGLCAAPNADSNSISANTIETYEFQHSNTAYTTTNNKNINLNQNNNNNNNNNYNNNNYNNYNTNLNKNNNRFVSYSSSNNNNNNILNNKHIINTKSTTNTFQTFSSSFSKFNQQAFTTFSQNKNSDINTSGTSFGTSARGGSHSFSTEKSQYKYKNKLESYRPSPAEFEKSVLKHTILRTYIDGNQPQPQTQPETQSQSQSQTQTQSQTQSQQFTQQFTVLQQPLRPVQLRQTADEDQNSSNPSPTENPSSTATKAPSHGWSLLTWRG